MTKVIIHCSQSDWGNAALIAKWHTKERGWVSIGYHYVILNGRLSKQLEHRKYDGHVETGRPLDDDNEFESLEMGAHTRGYNNSVGICLVGQSNSYTDKQLGALYELVSDLRRQYGDIEVCQHSDFEPKKPFCAGLSKEFIKEL